MRYLMLGLLVLCLYINSCFSSEPINVNSATAQEIESSLPGIGRVKAHAIVDHRSANGPFTNVQQLLDVKGIGPRTLERITPLITFNNGATDARFNRQLRKSEQYDEALRQAIRRIISRAQKSAELDRKLRKD